VVRKARQGTLMRKEHHLHLSTRLRKAQCLLYQPPGRRLAKHRPLRSCLARFLGSISSGSRAMPADIDHSAPVYTEAKLKPTGSRPGPDGGLHLGAGLARHSHAHVPEAGRRSTVAGMHRLRRLALAAVWRAPHHPVAMVADGIARAPE